MFSQIYTVLKKFTLFNFEFIEINRLMLSGVVLQLKILKHLFESKPFGTFLNYYLQSTMNLLHLLEIIF